MQPLSLARQLQNCTGASLGLQTSMRRTAARFNSKDSSSLATGLCATTISRWFQHQYRVRPARCRFNELFSGATSRFFITGQQQHDWTFRSEPGSSAGLHYFKREGAVGLHIKYARSVRTISLQPPGPLLQRVPWVNRIRMAQNDDWLFARFTKCSYPQMFSIVFAGYPFNRCPPADRRSSGRQQRNYSFATCLVARRRFRFDQRARKRNDRVLTAVEVVTQCCDS